MIHAVPTVLARNKELAEVFQKHWHEHVSPGRLVFAQRDEGRELLQHAIESGFVTSEQVETREFFR